MKKETFILLLNNLENKYIASPISPLLQNHFDNLLTIRQIAKHQDCLHYRKALIVKVMLIL